MLDLFFAQQIAVLLLPYEGLLVRLTQFRVDKLSPRSPEYPFFAPSPVIIYLSEGGRSEHPWEDASIVLFRNWSSRWVHERRPWSSLRTFFPRRRHLYLTRLLTLPLL